MSPATRTRYFALWARAAAIKSWNPKDESQRHATVLACMVAVRGPQVTTSHTLFGPDEITALFCYLEFLAAPSDLLKSARWVDCQQDYHAFNRARQADWHEDKAYGRQGSGKLRRNRFAGQESAEGEPLDKFDPVAIRKRHLTMVGRHESKGYRRAKKTETEVRPIDPSNREINVLADVHDGNPF